jgi:hypothetical protein
MDNINERMHPILEKELKKKEHSLGGCSIIPDGEEYSLFENLVNERFREVCNKVKRANDTDKLDDKLILGSLLPNVYEAMSIETKHRKKLQELAVKMIREEFDLPNDIKIEATLTPNINMEKVNLVKDNVTEEMVFDNYDSILDARQEIQKRRFLNAMTQGAAKKCNHMFHMVDDDLTSLDPRLPNKYNKIMTAADYSYFKIPKMDRQTSGGVVRVENNDNGYPIIKAEAMVFPVLIHELVKGVMEILSSHGLPKNKKMCKYVLGQSDVVTDEPWDMRLGPVIWSKFTNLFEDEDFNLKHHVYSDLASLPTREFNRVMKEILMNTKEGKKIIKEMCDNVKEDFVREEYEEKMNKMSAKTDNINNQNNGDIFNLDDFSEFF